jgi:carbonic anhydrase/acetyltransferase-like protein (isoleucine patch superfamily)
MALFALSGVEPKLGRDVFIAPNATVIGDVVLGDESSVWFNVVIRGDVFPIRFGARTNIQDGSVIHVTGGKAATTVGDDVTIGHMVLLHGCTVGSRSLIGMGSVVLDNAVIGDEVVLGAGSLVPPRAVIPPRSLAIGRPAKVIRQLTEGDLAMVKEAGDLYVQYARTFRSSALEQIG